MTREEAIAYITEWMKDEFALNKNDREALKTAMQALNSLEEVYANGYNDGFTQAEVNYENDKALSQEPCELLIIKSDILLHQDDRKKWIESIKREKESGVIILPPYFEPLLVPADIEINMVEPQESEDKE